jgi:ABC-2 type transport system ATP-binding protein
MIRMFNLMDIINIEGLTKIFSYYEKQLGIKSSFKNLFYRKKLFKDAVKKVSFQIKEGEIVGFLGPNGAGKTTTLKMLAGILFPTSGTAHVSGYVPWERKKQFKMLISIIMGQKSQLWWDLPASESLYLNKCIYEIDNDVYSIFLDELTEMLDVKRLLNIQVRRLSLGERMKMELIASLIHKPKILFLDEPTIGLDIISQKKIREFLKYYNEQNKTTILLTSHYMKDIENLCKRTIVINNGEIIYDGELNGINGYFSGKKLIKLQLDKSVDINVLKEFGDIKEIDGTSVVFEVARNEVSSLSGRMIESLPVLDFTIEDIPVEEGITLLFEKGKKK